FVGCAYGLPSNLPGQSAELLAIGKGIVERRVDVEHDLSKSAIEAIHGNIVKGAGHSIEGEAALLNFFGHDVIVAHDQTQMIDSGPLVNGEESVEITSLSGYPHHRAVSGRTLKAARMPAAITGMGWL